MKISGPSILPALIAAAVLWLFLRGGKASAAVRPGNSVSGAPVPDLQTSLAEQQDSLLGSILTTLRSGSSGHSTTTATTTTGSAGAGPGSTGGTHPTPTPTTPPPVTHDAAWWQQWAASQHQLGSVDVAAATAAGVYPTGQFASGYGFLSSGWIRLQNLLGF